MNWSKAARSSVVPTDRDARVGDRHGAEDRGTRIHSRHGFVGDAEQRFPPRSIGTEYGVVELAHSMSDGLGPGSLSFHTTP